MQNITLACSPGTRQLHHSLFQFIGSSAAGPGCSVLIELSETLLTQHGRTRVHREPGQLIPATSSSG